MNEYSGWFSFGILILGILNYVGKKKTRQGILTLIRMSLDVIHFITDKEKQLQLKKSLSEVNNTIQPYIINQFVFKLSLLLSLVIYLLVTKLCVIYVQTITISHNIYLAYFVAIILMVANINMLYRAALLYKSLKKAYT